MAGDEQFAMTLTVPSEVRLFRPVRLAIGGMANLAGFDVEAIDDLRIGVDELLGALLDAGAGGDIVLTCDTVTGRSIRLHGTTAAGQVDTDLARFALSERLLSVVADSHGLELGETEVTCWLERLVS